MKRSTLIIIILVLVVLMIHKPGQTTAQVQGGEQGAIDLGSAAFGGLFTPKAQPASTGSRKGR